MSTIFCLDCEREIDLGPSPTIGQRLVCPNCEVAMEIINLDPLELDWIYDGPVTRSPLFDLWWSSSEKKDSKQDQSAQPA
jgi:hypothetical protein